jgi:hypothetical protein
MGFCSYRKKSEERQQLPVPSLSLPVLDKAGRDILFGLLTGCAE